MDPLSPSGINAGWSTSPPPRPSQPLSPSTPTTPVKPLPTTRTRSTGGAGPSSPSSARDPKVFGASGSPDSTKRPGPFLRVRIGALERNRKDLLVRFDTSTNLPNFRLAMYRNIQRSYIEFQRFAEQVQMTSPQTIIPALPLPTTSAVTDEEDDRLVKIALQKWFTRICEDPILMKDDELRSFIESDFGYTPVPPPHARRPMNTSSAVPQVLTAALSKVVRRGPLDEDDDLQSARAALEKLEDRWGGAATAIGNLGKARRAHALASADLGGKWVSLSTVESDPSLAAGERKVGRSLEQLSGMGGAQASSENVVLSDTLGYQALNARAAKDALSQRTQLLEDAQAATKSAINKRRNVERLKGSSNINPMKVDDALSEMEEANTLESSLTVRLQAISTNLHGALRAHSRHTHEDVAVALLENARLSISYHKHTLRELEALRPDLARIGTNNVNAITSSTVTSTVAPSNGNGNANSLPPSMSSSRPYQSPPLAAPPPSDVSRSMFLPNPPQQVNQPPPRAAAIAPAPPLAQGQGRADPLGGSSNPTPTMAQSMMLPGQRGAQTLGPGQARRLDSRQAAKMLSGGF